MRIRGENRRLGLVPPTLPNAIRNLNEEATGAWAEPPKSSAVNLLATHDLAFTASYALNKQEHRRHAESHLTGRKEGGNDRGAAEKDGEVPFPAANSRRKTPPKWFSGPF